MEEESEQLNTVGASRQLWTIKVPSLVAQAWSQCRDSSLAKVLQNVDPLRPGQIEWELELGGGGVGGGSNIPRCYVLDLQKDVQPMQVFSEQESGKRLCAEGRVVVKLDTRMSNRADERYRQLCRDREAKFNTKTRKTMPLDAQAEQQARVVPLPSQHKDINKKRVLAGGAAASATAAAGSSSRGVEKRCRGERGEVEDRVFKLFEAQGNWTLKALVAQTDQPESFLREILNDLCVYNKRGKNQGSYELKPEYRPKEPSS